MRLLSSPHHLPLQMSMAEGSEEPPQPEHNHTLPVSFPTTCSGYSAAVMTALATYDNSRGGRVTPNTLHSPGTDTYSGLALLKKYQCAYLSSFSWSWTLSGGGSYRTKAPSSRGSWRARRTPALFRPNAREPRGPRNQQSTCELTLYNQALQQAQLKCPSFTEPF